jgi:ubiquinone/menaquinone biosynthesis C-methylase UbiE
MRQREIFLNGEGDNWYERNKHQLKNVDSPDLQCLINYLIHIKGTELKFLEIGCSNGRKVLEISKRLGWDGFGIDPSAEAILRANQNKAGNTTFSIGTADALSFEDNFFDCVFFGFCLYLVDRDDINAALSESIRVLKPGGLIAILDFDYGGNHKNIYTHDNRVTAFKQDYSSFFLNLGGILIAKESYIGAQVGFSDDPDNRIALYIIKMGSESLN